MQITKLPVEVPPLQNPDDDSATTDAAFVFPPESFPSLELFSTTTLYPALSVPLRDTATVRKLCKDLQVQGIKNVLIDPNDATNRRLVLLTESTTQEAAMEQVKDYFSTQKSSANDDETPESSSSSRIRWVAGVPIVRPYDEQSSDEILRKLLPSSIREVPSSFELVGHLAHVNLRDEVLPYQHWIGQVLLDKNAAVRTVVHKVGTIETEFRTFDMRVIAGEASDGWSVATVHEHGSSFVLDYRHVYWNSRLAGEHRRLVQAMVGRGDEKIVVADLMAGVGPFAVPLSKRGCTVYANDLNPASFQYLEINKTKNKCKNLHCYNIDARAFWHQLVDDKVTVHHVIMNLPASAPEFLDAFRGCALSSTSSSDTAQQQQLPLFPTLHVHCFAPKDDAPAYLSARTRCEASLGCPIPDETVSIKTVRDVSPRMNMVCVTFPLPPAVLDVPRISLIPKAGDAATIIKSNNNNKDAVSDAATEKYGSTPDAKRQKVVQDDLLDQA